ncbi:MAG: arylsulfatase [Asticcacaulis sp.]
MTYTDVAVGQKSERLSLSRRLTTFMLAAGLSAIVGGGVFAAFADPAKPATAKKPNFLIIVADDLGFSDLGAFGGEIQTPNLDRLAFEGVRLTSFHSAPMCAPTRAQLLTGADNNRIGLGQMSEPTPARYKGIAGFEGALSDNVATLPEILRDNGYRTVQSGKWHLGGALEKDPSRRGFQYSFSPAKGGFRDNGRDVGKLADNVDSSDEFTTRFIDKLKQSRAAGDDKPFFGYLAFTAPHWPMQAPAASIAKYRGRYDKGYEVLRAERIKRQAELGLIDANAPHVFSDEVKPWKDLTPQEKAYYIAAREVYSGMVDRLDYNVGRLVAYLKSTGEYDNTVILFVSDNGAAGRDLSRDQKPEGRFLKADNRPENIGNPTSFASIGAGWAEAASAPAKLYKQHASEGGTRVAAFITYRGFANKGGIGRAYGHVRDATPTFLELAGIPVPKDEYNGKRIFPVTGRSQVAWLTGKADRVYPIDAPVGVMFAGSRSMRKGDWKLLSLRNEGWRLYNLASDPGETKDLTAAHPEKAQELLADWTAYARENVDPAFAEAFDQDFGGKRKSVATQPGSID